MEDRDMIIGIVGAGGDGVLTIGEMLVRGAAALGLYAMQLKSFGAQIRGGESSCKVRISNQPVQSQGDRINLLVAYNWKDYKQFAAELTLAEDVVILCPENDPTPVEEIPLEPVYKRCVRKLPIEKLSEQATGAKASKNVVSLGMLVSFMGLPPDPFKDTVKERFGRKSEELAAKNLHAFDMGYGHVQAAGMADVCARTRFALKGGGDKLVLTGNDAFALGALHAGAEFFSGYPITPSTEIMEIMSKELIAAGGTFIQTEDEIAACAMAIGASFAGKRAFTATSGPGVSLMIEGIGLACIAELPLVIVNVQRGGPSTGIPTKTEQGDLLQAIFGCHGDAPKVVLAPCDVRDCFNAAVEAFYIAEHWQIPVIVLSDQFIGHRVEAVDVDHFVVDEKSGHFRPNAGRLVAQGDDLNPYIRYRITEGGVSPITHPGMEGGAYLCAGISHNEVGAPTARVDIHHEQAQKRYAKMSAIHRELSFLRYYGPPEAKTAVLCWGSTKGAVKEALARFNAASKTKIKAAVPQILYPFPDREMEAFLKGVESLVVVEMSYSSQFLKYLRAFIDLPARVIHHKRPGGAPFTVEEIVSKMEEAVRHV